MPTATPIRRVILVVLDGLRPDAIPRFGLAHLTALAHGGASTMLARTVHPSVTAAAMASLLTGAAPARHGLEDTRFRIPRARGSLHPLPRMLAAHGLPTTAHLARMPFLLRGVARRIAAHLGVMTAHFRGHGCADILDAAVPALRDQDRGLILMHWPDGDRAGHAHGWMSAPYADAARAMDAATGRLAATVDLADPRTLLIALADHGGGGAVPDHHDSLHPLDTTIPLILAGGAVRTGTIAQGASLLDVPATVCWALGVAQPESYPGRALVDAFGAPMPAVAA